MRAGIHAAVLGLYQDAVAKIAAVTITLITANFVLGIKGDNRVWAYDTGSQQLEVLYDFVTSDNPILSGVDNVVITPTGDLLLAEDGGDMQIVVITPNRQLKPIVQIAGHDRSEITGPAFDPSHERLYFSSQRGSSGLPSGGITYEISRTKKISR